MLLQTHSERRGWAVCSAHYHQIMKLYPYLVYVRVNIEQESKEVDELIKFQTSGVDHTESVGKTIISDVYRRQATLQSMHAVKTGLANHIMFELIDKCKSRETLRFAQRKRISPEDRKYTKTYIEQGQIWKSW